MGKLPVSFGIFGTCDSVDIFEFNEKGKIYHHIPMRGSSILTTDISRLKYNLDALYHTSSLATDMVKHILNGQVYEFLKENRGEYLMIDLVEERMPFVKFEDQLYLYSPWFRDSNAKELLEKEYTLEYVEHQDLDSEFIEERINVFCERIKELYPEEKIIINEVVLSKDYIDENAKVHEFTREEFVRWSEKSISIIRKMYQILEEKLPKAKILDASKIYLAHTENIRGLSPCHFIPDYYKERYNELLKIVKEDHSLQREKSIENLSFDGKLQQRKSKLLKMGMSNICAYFLGLCMEFTELKNKNVLWIGKPVIRRDIARALKCKKFVYLTGDTVENLDIKEFFGGGQMYNFTDRYISPRVLLKEKNFACYNGSVEQLTPDFCDYFDVVVVLSELEHIIDLSLFFDNVYKCLTYGGKFFGKPGRIWGAPYGSEWKINKDYTYLNCTNIDIEYWPHLLENVQSVSGKLLQWGIDEDAIPQASYSIINGNQNEKYNRFFYEDYKFYLAKSLFSKKSIAPLAKVEIDENMYKKVLSKYKGYTHFEYNTLFIYCEK